LGKQTHEYADLLVVESYANIKDKWEENICLKNG